MPLKPPRIPVLALPALCDGDGGGFAAGADRLRIEGADLSGVRARDAYFRESELVNLRLDGARLGGCRFLEVRCDRLDAPDLDAGRSVWRDCELHGSRLGSFGLFGAELTGVRFVGCKISYLGLQDASLSDVSFEDCQLDEIDAGGAELRRVRFVDTSIGELRLPGAMLQHVDLRSARLGAVAPVTALSGATLSAAGLLDLAPQLAAGLGIDIA